MNDKIYIHDIPGRLRVRTEAMKDDQQAAARLRELLAAVPGVLSVNVNTLTGSTIVTYNAGAITSAPLLEVFRANGFLAAQTMAPSASWASDLFAQVVAPKLTGWILGWTVERALAAAVAALL